MTAGAILVVEDDPVARLITERQLAKLGFSCETAGSGEETIERYPNNFVLIFMDIGLPGIDGLRTTMIIRELEREYAWKRMPIIALTAHADETECLLAGMDDFLQKPAWLRDLASMLERWLPIK